jgi:hypothetical protein
MWMSGCIQVGSGLINAWSISTENNSCSLGGWSAGPALSVVQRVPEIYTASPVRKLQKRILSEMQTEN